MFMRIHVPRDPKNVQRYNNFLNYANKFETFLLFFAKR